MHGLRRILNGAPSAAALALAMVLLAGCEGAAYLGQAAWGQARLVAARRPIERVLADAGTPAPLRVQLERVRALRAFASDALGMGAARGFDSFAATGREFAVWNVVAAPEFSVTPREWCFPVVGCVSYRGYFASAGAERFAAQLASAGEETWVYGVAAYSTLGWFDDPVLDTWVMRKERALAALIFHELAHQLVYAPGDTAFSEAFARVVEREAVRRWLRASGRSQEYAEYLQEQEVDRTFAALVEGTRAKLAALYAEPLAPDAMRVRKRELLDALRAEYGRQSAAWPPEYRYDRWMAGPLDNARLATVANYEERAPALEALLVEHNGDLPAFYAAATALAALPEAERAARLDQLAAVAHRARSDGSHAG